MKKLLVILLLVASVARGDCRARYRGYDWYEDCRVAYIPGIGYYEVCGYYPYPYYAQPDNRPHWQYESYYWELERAKH